MSPPEDWYPNGKSMPERLATLEERISNIKNEMGEIKSVVDEIHAIILQGKGAKWAIISFVGLVSGFFSVLAHKFFPFLK